MKKRILFGLILTLLITCLLPIGASAYTAVEKFDIFKISAESTLKDKYTWDSNTRTLTITGEDVTLSKNYDVYDYRTIKTSKVNIIIEKGASLTCQNRYSVYSLNNTGDVTVKGSFNGTALFSSTTGNVTVEGGKLSFYSVKGNVNIKDSRVNLSRVSGDVEVSEDSDVDIGYELGGDLTASDSEIRIGYDNEEFVWTGKMNVSNCDVEIRNYDAGETPIILTEGRLKFTTSFVGKLEVKGGTAELGMGAYEDAAGKFDGELCVSGGQVLFAGALKGKLDVSGGKVEIECGATLTQDSTISGGEVKITGAKGTFGSNKGRPALNREGNAKLRISGGSILLMGGISMYEPGDRSPGPDYLNAGEAVAAENVNMLEWNSPVQLETGDYNVDEIDVTWRPQWGFKGVSTANSQSDLTGKQVIQSFKGWTVTYDPGFGTIKEGEISRYIVADNAPFRTDAYNKFVAPEGYEFLGWEVIMDGKTTTNTTDFKVTADAVIKAVWKGPYTMTFIVDGEEVASITQISGTKVTPPEDPVKEGYIFAGWDVAVPGTMPTKNMVFVAQWKLPQAAVVAADLPETGDPGSLMNWIALLGVSGIAAKALRSRKR